MEGRLEQWLKQKINGVMPPLNVKQVPTAEIHHRLVEVCGDSVMSRQFLVCRILNRSSDVPRSGRTTTAGTAVNKTRFERAILEEKTSDYEQNDACIESVKLGRVQNWNFMKYVRDGSLSPSEDHKAVDKYVEFICQ